MEINHNFTSIQQVQETYLHQTNTVSKNKETSRSFEEIFYEKSVDSAKEEIKFSKHADARLTDRNITLTQEQLERLEQGTRKADEKGIRESLVIMDNLSFIVNVKNRTVITAMEQTNDTENIYTNIDGAVII